MEVGFRITSPPSVDKTKKVYIYILYSPSELRVRYVGQSVNPAARYGSYTRIESKKCQSIGGGANPFLLAWMQNLWNAGEHPVMEIVAECDPRVSSEVEKSFIEAADMPGSGLLNVKHTRKRIASGFASGSDEYKTTVESMLANGLCDLRAA